MGKYWFNISIFENTTYCEASLGIGILHSECAKKGILFYGKQLSVEEKILNHTFLPKIWKY